MPTQSHATAVLERPGARLVYDVTGTGPAVVLVHGFGLDRRMWDPQAEYLAARFRVVRYDCRGFGASGPFDPAVPYTHAGDLVALLDHLGVGQAVLAGLSFGGRVVLQTALAAPDRVRGLVLLDAVLDGVPWDRESEAGLAEVARQVRAGGVPAGRVAWLAHPLFAAARQRARPGPPPGGHGRRVPRPALARPRPAPAGRAGALRRAGAGGRADAGGRRRPRRAGLPRDVRGAGPPHPRAPSTA